MQGSFRTSHLSGKMWLRVRSRGSRRQCGHDAHIFSFSRLSSAWPPKRRLYATRPVGRGSPEGPTYRGADAGPSLAFTHTEQRPTQSLHVQLPRSCGGQCVAWSSTLRACQYLPRRHLVPVDLLSPVIWALQMLVDVLVECTDAQLVAFGYIGHVDNRNAARMGGPIHPGEDIKSDSRDFMVTPNQIELLLFANA